MDTKWMFRCRAECLTDVAKLILEVGQCPESCSSMMSPSIYQGSMLSDVKVSWVTMIPEWRMREIVGSIPDGHRMLETLTYDEVFAGVC